MIVLENADLCKYTSHTIQKDLPLQITGSNDALSNALKALTDISMKSVFGSNLLVNFAL